MANRKISPPEKQKIHGLFTKPWKKIMERVMGIEPTSSAWKAEALPLCYTRI